MHNQPVANWPNAIQIGPCRGARENRSSSASSGGDRQRYIDEQIAALEKIKDEAPN
jgi:hypothetical protein